MIELIIPELEAEKKTERYSYQQLKDLQSKLMLIAGKSGQAKEGVDRFVDVCVGVVSGLCEMCNNQIVHNKHLTGDGQGVCQRENTEKSQRYKTLKIVMCLYIGLTTVSFNQLP